MWLQRPEREGPLLEQLVLLPAEPSLQQGFPEPHTSGKSRYNLFLSSKSKNGSVHLQGERKNIPGSPVPEVTS